MARSSALKQSRFPLLTLVFLFPWLIEVHAAVEPHPTHLNVSFDVSLDSHFHLWSTEENPQDFFDRHKIWRALLISPSFQSWPQRKKWDLVVSEFTQKNPSRWGGICGADLERNDLSSHVNWCLSLPGMKGVKVHLANLQSPNSQYQHSGACLSEDPAVFEKLNNLISSFPEKPVFVLIHFVPTCENSRSEVHKIIELAQNNPRVQFVLAHSFSLDGIETLSELKSPEVKNMWIEISTLEDSVHWFGPEAFKRYAKAWKKFDLDQVLFGTDNFNPDVACPSGIPIEVCDFHTAKSTKSLIRDENLFSAEEQRKILWDNGLRFWNLFSESN